MMGFWKRGKQELRVVRCTIGQDYDSDLVFVLRGNMEIPDRALVELSMMVKGIKARFALVEIMERNITGDYQAVPVWLTWEKIPWLALEHYVYPHVIADPFVRRYTVEAYMEEEGSPGLAYVLQANGQIYFVHRRTNAHNPWACYRRVEMTEQCLLLTETPTLAKMKAFMTQTEPALWNQIAQWGTQGSRILNPIDYGAVGDGKVDDLIPVNRMVADARRGDVLFFPPERKFRWTRPIMIPKFVEVDWNLNNIVRDYGNTSEEFPKMK